LESPLLCTGSFGCICRSAVLTFSLEKVFTRIFQSPTPGEFENLSGMKETQPEIDFSALIQRMLKTSPASKLGRSSISVTAATTASMQLPPSFKTLRSKGRKSFTINLQSNHKKGLKFL